MELRPSPTPIIETIASQESVVATRLWVEAGKLDQGNPLAAVLLDGAAALKGMALSASGADAILKPYSDTHDEYHRIKRERHSYEPHYAKAMTLINDGHGGAWREKIEHDLKEALALAMDLRQETPLLRYLKRVVSEPSIGDDVLVVLRHAEDAQQTTDLLLDFVTAPGNLAGRAPNLRVTTASRYSAELEIRSPESVIWAATATAGMRAFVGDSIAPRVFRLVVAGHDTVTLRRSLDVVSKFGEFDTYRSRVELLRNSLPWAPAELGGIRGALSFDVEKPRAALPFIGQGYLLLDGYGPIAASPGSQFYVLDPATQQLHPREARAIDVGDSVFAMSTAIREEIEALLREKDEGGRTFEQALVDQYKAIVKSGIEKLSLKDGQKMTGARVHEILFEQNPNLPPISKHAVDYWLQAADHLDVDTPYAASNPLHFEAFLKLMGAGVMARQMTDAVRVVRHALRRDGHTNRTLFDRLLLDPDSLIHTARSVTFERLRGLRSEALENVFTVLDTHLGSVAPTASNSPTAQVMTI